MPRTKTEKTQPESYNDALLNALRDIADMLGEVRDEIKKTREMNGVSRSQRDCVPYPESPWEKYNPPITYREWSAEKMMKDAIEASNKMFRNGKHHKFHADAAKKTMG